MSAVLGAEEVGCLGAEGWGEEEGVVGCCCWWGGVGVRLGVGGLTSEGVGCGFCCGFVDWTGRGGDGGFFEG